MKLRMTVARTVILLAMLLSAIVIVLLLKSPSEMAELLAFVLLTIWGVLIVLPLARRFVDWLEPRWITPKETGDRG